MPVNGVQVLDGTTGEFLECVTDRDTTAIASPTVVTDDGMLKEACFEECKAAGWCCNDPDIGSNQLLSCAQACMIRARGTDEYTCTQKCDAQHLSRGCWREVNGHWYSMCSSCNDLDDTCPHGVQDANPCHDGCQMSPQTTDQQRVIAGQCCEGCGLPWAVPAPVQASGGFSLSVSMRVMVDGYFQTSGTLAAFVGDEVRGVATPSAVPFGPFMNQGTVLFQVSVWATQAEQLTWKFCDGDRMVTVDPPCSFVTSQMWSEPFVNQYLGGCVPGDGCVNHGNMADAKAKCISFGDQCGGVLTGGTGHWEIRRDRVPRGNTHETSYVYTPMCPGTVFGGPTDAARYFTGTSSDQCRRFDGAEDDVGCIAGKSTVLSKTARRKASRGVLI